MNNHASNQSRLSVHFLYPKKQLLNAVPLNQAKQAHFVGASPDLQNGAFYSKPQTKKPAQHFLQNTKQALFNS